MLAIAAMLLSVVFLVHVLTKAAMPCALQQWD